MQIIKDQVKERSVVVLVLDKEFVIWKDSGPKALSRHVQMRHMDAEYMRVVKIEEFGKVGKSVNSNNVLKDGVKMEKFGEKKSCKIGEFQNRRGRERCWRREIVPVNHKASQGTIPRDATLAVVEAEDQRVLCMGDVRDNRTELSWHASCISTFPDMSTCSWKISDSNMTTQCRFQQYMTWQTMIHNHWIKHNPASADHTLTDVCSSVKIEQTYHSLSTGCVKDCQRLHTIEFSKLMR